MEKLKVGIIGLGGIARSHCDAIATLDNVEVVAVADLFEAKRREYMEKYGIPKGYETHTELLQDDEVDAVAVVLGHQLHHRLTVDSCNAGKHVLVEKPMAINLQQCDDMIAAAAANNVKLMVGYSQHYYATSVKAKENPRFGRSRTAHNSGVLHVQELGIFRTASAVPQSLPRRWYVADQWRSCGRPTHMGDGVTSSVGIGIYRCTCTLPSG